MKTNTLFQVRFRPSVKPPRGFTKSAHYNVLNYDRHHDKYLIGNTWLPASYFIKIEVEDAPVFQKPVLRKIASLKPDEVIECNEPEVLKAVLEQAIKEGLKDAEATLIQINESESIDSYPLCIGYKYKINDCFFQHNGISYSGRSFYESECCTILPASKFVEVAAEEQPITQAQKDECRKIDDEIFNSPFSNQGELVDRNNQLTGQIETMKRLAKIALSNEDYEHMRVILRSIANGEI